MDFLCVVLPFLKELIQVSAHASYDHLAIQIESFTCSSSQSIETVPVEPGRSGIQIQVKCDTLQEGFRPRRIVRFYPGSWKVVALPREEQFFGRE